MMMECYFDDSSDPKRQHYFACGGVVGGQEQWDAFDVLWANETAGLKEPFRATECECGHGQFTNWEKPERDALMARLVNVLHLFKLYGIASIVPIEAFKRVFPNLDSKEAFFLAVTQNIMNMAHVAHQSYMNLLYLNADLWFERGPHNGAIQKIYDDICALDWKPAQRLTGFHLKTKELRPLQAADMVAREAFKHIDNLGIRQTRRPVLEMSDTLCFLLWTEKSLAYLAANGGPRNLKFLSEFNDSLDAPLLQHFWRKSWAFHEKVAREKKQ